MSEATNAESMDQNIPTYIHPDIAKMSTDEINNLKGAGLKNVAAECQIKGRSTMKANDLRDAIATVVTGYQDAKRESLADELSAMNDSVNATLVTDKNELDAFIDTATDSLQRTLSEDVDIEERLQDVHNRASKDGNALYGPAPLPTPDPSNETIKHTHDCREDWQYDNREARRKAARKQRKAQGRIAQKENRINR